MSVSGLELRIIQTDPAYDPQIGPWVWALEDTRRRTLRTLDGISSATLEWIPPEGGNTIGTLLYHLVAIEMSYLYEDILGLDWAPELDALLPYPIRTDEGLLAQVQKEDLATHLQRLEGSRALLLNTLRSMTIDEWRRPRTIEHYSITPEWALHHLMQHEAEHRGQIGELRLRAEQAQAAR